MYQYNYSHNNKLLFSIFKRKDRMSAKIAAPKNMTRTDLLTYGDSENKLQADILIPFCIHSGKTKISPPENRAASNR